MPREESPVNPAKLYAITIEVQNFFVKHVQIATFRNKIEKEVLPLCTSLPKFVK